VATFRKAPHIEAKRLDPQGLRRAAWIFFAILLVTLLAQTWAAA